MSVNLIALICLSLSFFLHFDNCKLVFYIYKCVSILYIESLVFFGFHRWVILFNNVFVWIISLSMIISISSMLLTVFSNIFSHIHDFALFMVSFAMPKLSAWLNLTFLFYFWCLRKVIKEYMTMIYGKETLDYVLIWSLWCPVLYLGL